MKYITKLEYECIIGEKKTHMKHTNKCKCFFCNWLEWSCEMQKKAVYLLSLIRGISIKVVNLIVQRISLIDRVNVEKSVTSNLIGQNHHWEQL